MSDKYDTVIEQLTLKYKKEVISDDDDAVDYLFDETKNYESINFSSLAEIPLENLQEFKVSSLSLFKDTIWDWREEGSSVYKNDCFYSWKKELGKGVSLLSQENKHICIFLKMMGFYSLPQNAVLQNVKSFNTSKIIMKDLKEVGKFLYKNKIFVDVQGNGSFVGTVYLTKEHFLDFINKDLKNSRIKYAFAKQVKHWLALSESELIPVKYRLNFDPFDEEVYSGLVRKAEDDKGTFLPISIETLAMLIPYSIEYIENKSTDALKLYSIMWPKIAGSKIAKNKTFDWNVVEEKLKEMDIKYLGFNDPVSKKNILNNTINLITELRNACVAILFLVTGMRNSEMYLLEVGDCWKVKGSDDDFKIKIIVTKGSEGSIGYPVILPIPEIGYKAFKCLEALTEQARMYGKTNKLMVGPTVKFGKEINSRSINAFLENWCKKLDIEHIHPHQFRKTLAMFAIYQDPNNIGLIKRLFSHKSLAMTLVYIVKMPGMAEEIKLAVIEKNQELLSELLEAIDKSCIGGKAGTRIQRLISEQEIVKSKLNDDGWEGLDQYIQILLQDGLNILHRTSFGAICTNTHSALVHLAPESCNCNVTDCNWSVFTLNSIDDLQDTIKFHQGFMKNEFSSEGQKRFSKKTIKDCIERLYELKGLDYIKIKFPDFVIDNVKLIELWGDKNSNQNIKT